MEWQGEGSKAYEGHQHACGDIVPELHSEGQRSPSPDSSVYLCSQKARARGKTLPFLHFLKHKSIKMPFILWWMFCPWQSWPSGTETGCCVKWNAWCEWAITGPNCLIENSGILRVHFPVPRLGPCSLHHVPLVCVLFRPRLESWPFWKQSYVLCHKSSECCRVTHAW